jgi:predicted nucleotidyltransferase
MPNLGSNIPKMGMKAKRQSVRRVATSHARTVSSLTDALFSKTQQRVLALVFGQPDRSFFATELIQLTGSGSGAVQRELARLAESGLVVVTRVGHQKHFQANPRAPVFEELRSIVLKTIGLEEPLRAALRSLDNRIRFAILHGSTVRRSDHAASDVDVLIVSDELTLEQVYAALGPVEQRLARKINPTLYTSAEFLRRRKSADSFVAKVLAGEHIVLTGSEHALAPAR